MKLYALSDLDQSHSLIAARDGIAGRNLWSTVEPREGVYHWANIDAQIAAAVAVGGKATISITPGVNTPQWVYDAGAAAFRWVWNHTYNPRRPVCSIAKMPLPWDAVYLAKWTAFVAAVGARYNGNPGVDHVKLTGINSSTQETMLPRNPRPSAINGGQCTSFNDVANWQAVGYTPAKIQGAWMQIALAFALAFPETQFAGVFIPGGFPPIDDNGRIYSRPAQDMTLALTLINLGVANWPGQFIVQNDAWSAFWVWEEIVAMAGEVETGLQELDAQGVMFAEAIAIAEASGVSFGEIYPVDVHSLVLSQPNVNTD